MRGAVSDAGPLADRTIVTVASPKTQEKLRIGLEALGARVTPFSASAVRELRDKSALDAALDSLERYAWIVFTSFYGVFFFSQRLNERKISPQRRALLKICAVGPATARSLEECGLRVSLLPEEFAAEGILDALAQRLGGLEALAGQRILLPRAKEARDLLPRELAAAGAHVEIVPCYETVLADPDESALRHLRQCPPDLLVFTSSSNISHFATLLGPEDAARILRTSRMAVLGPITASTAVSFGKRPEIVPPQNTVASLIEAIRQYYGGSP
jgi:uroporphyrinogen III methyltransferase / synthase